MDRYNKVKLKGDIQNKLYNLEHAQLELKHKMERDSLEHKRINGDRGYTGNFIDILRADIIVHKIDSIKWVLGLKEDLEVKDWDDRYINTLYVYKES